MKMRIQKYLSQQGLLSRRQAEHYLKKGWIKINGEVVTTPGVSVDPRVDKVELSKQIDKIRQNYKYLLFYKPRGIVTNLPQRGEKDIRSILPKKFNRLNAVGRLDKDSEGLIILTDDGVFSKALLQGKPPHEREYHVTLDRILNDKLIDRLEKGMLLFGEKTLPMKVKRLGQFDYKLTMVEGKNRQIRRMMAKIGREVKVLKRIRFAKAVLGTLNPGEFLEVKKGGIL